MIWLRRATGIGYRQYPPLENDPILRRHHGNLEMLSGRLQVEVSQLHRELRGGLHMLAGKSYDENR